MITLQKSQLARWSLDTVILTVEGEDLKPELNNFRYP